MKIGHCASIYEFDSMPQAVDKAVAESMVVNVDRKLTEKMLRSVSILSED